MGKIFRQVRKLYLLKVYKQMLVHVPSTSKYRTKTKMFWLIQSITQFIVNVLDAWEYWNFLSEVRPNKKNAMMCSQKNEWINKQKAYHMYVCSKKVYSFVQLI